MKKELRIGVLLKEKDIPAWFCTMLSEIDNLEGAKVIAIIQNEAASLKNKEAAKSGKYSIYNDFINADRKRFKSSTDASHLRNIDEFIGTDVLNDVEIFVKQNKDNIASIHACDIDIIVSADNVMITDDIIEASNYGVWKYYFGNYKAFKGGPTGFWEFFKEAPEMGVTLEMISKKGSLILAESTHLTDNVSIERGLNPYYWKSLSILPRKITELYTLGEEKFFNQVTMLNQHPSFYSNELYETPANGKMIKELLKFKLKRLRTRFKNLLFFNQWMLLFKLKDTPGLSTDFYEFKKILPPKDRFWADPHVIKKNNKYYIFIEELIYTENKGFISVIEMDLKGNYKPPVKVLETDYHLSYPFIIEDDGEIYMIPESKAAENIQLYKCIDFPYKWELKTVLMNNVKAVDTTIWFKDGKYWLFTNYIKNNGASIHNELFLYYSDKLVSNDWRRHPKSPIVSDVTNARMAGKLFEHNGKLYRPAQNCSTRYGYGMKINHVLEMNQDSYEEQTIDAIFPNWHKNLHATHSLTSDEELTVIDAQGKRRKYF